MPFATTRMDREGIALREITQRQTDKDRKVSPVRGEERERGSSWRKRTNIQLPDE